VEQSFAAQATARGKEPCFQISLRDVAARLPKDGMERARRYPFVDRYCERLSLASCENSSQLGVASADRYDSKPETS